MSADGDIDLSVVVVSYNVRSYLADCLRSLPAACQGLTWEVVVVDNASRDGSAESVAAEFPDARLVVNPENVGFARGVNTGLSLTRGRYVLLFNPDAEAPPDTLRRLVEVADAHPEVGLLSPAQRDPATGDVRAPLRPFPTWRTAFRDYTLARWVLPPAGPARLAEREARRPTAAGWLAGGTLLVRREVLDMIGGLDGRYFMWCEDIDYCRRAIRAGWPLFYVDDIVVDHHGGKSQRQERRGYVLFRRFESLLTYLSDDRPGQARILRPFFVFCLLTTLLARLPAHALKAMTYRALGRAHRADRHRQRLVRTAEFLGEFPTRLLRR